MPTFLDATPEVMYKIRAVCPAVIDNGTYVYIAAFSNYKFFLRTCSFYYILLSATLVI